MSRPHPESPTARLRRVLVPGTTGGLYTLWSGTLGFLVVLAMYAHAYLTARPMPGVTGELLTASVGLLGLHTVRGTLADRANAASGLGPVPVESGAPPAPSLPDLRPTDTPR